MKAFTWDCPKCDNRTVRVLSDGPTAASAGQIGRVAGG
jgi:hypothetical protein